MSENDKSSSAGCGAALAGILIVAVCMVITKSCNKTPEQKIEEQTTDMKISAWIAAKNAVKAKLKSPTSADFPFDDYRFDKVDESTCIIHSYVDATNSFGAKIRTDFAVKVHVYGSSCSIDPDDVIFLNQ